MERLDQGHLLPSIKHRETDMSWLGFSPLTSCTPWRALYQRAIATVYVAAFRNLYSGFIKLIQFPSTLSNIWFSYIKLDSATAV
jgi:hypothetical protein